LKTFFPFAQPQAPQKKKSYKEMKEEQRIKEEAERRPSLIVPDEVKLIFLARNLNFVIKTFQAI
jgi:hypothetical protein